MMSGVSREIALRDDADETPVLVDDRHAPDLMMRHLPHALGHGLLRVAREHTLGHAVGDDSVTCIASRRDDTKDNVSIGDHANEDAIVSDHWQRAAVAFFHE